MSKFMDRYSRMKEAGLVGGTSSDEIRGDSFTENESAAAKPGAFTERYNRMKEAGLVGTSGISQASPVRAAELAEEETPSSVPAAEVVPGAFTERYNRFRQNRADGIRQSIEAWNEENKKLARSYGEHSGEFIKARSDALRTSGESLKQRIKDSGLYDDDTVSALGEGCLLYTSPSPRD